ncbi:MAG: 50S ribosomal protein L4 [Elusimicrobia bacterium]|nr:50S ribosomal protein L4 [Elusimicrobiota bacterium]
MTEAGLISKTGEISGKVSLPENYFSAKANPKFMNEALKAYLAKSFTLSVKTKSEVRGGGKKPFRQKGTGNARAGSNRSPIWRGGGVIFGPSPRTVSNYLTRKKKKLALVQALSFLASQNKIFAAEEVSFEKTKQAAEWVGKNFKRGQKILIVLDKAEKGKILPFRNLPGVEIVSADALNIRLLLYRDAVIFMGKSLEKFS